MFVYTNSQVTKIDSTPPAYFINQISKPGLNDKGEIAYTRQMDENHFDLVLFKNGNPTVLQITGALDSYVQLNEAGVIAFNGVNSHGALGVRTYFDGITNDVVGFGDTLFGKQSTYVNVFDINEKNQLALTVDFTDGSTAILIATLVPEVSGVHLAIVAIIASLPTRRRCGYRG
jgi:hypothetical protein